MFQIENAMSHHNRDQYLNDNALLKWCNELPKIELHAHLNGSLRSSTVQELLDKKNKQMKEKDANVQMPTIPVGTSLQECMDLFGIIHSVVNSSLDITRRTTREVLEDFESDGCAYLEIRTQPKQIDGKSKKE